MNNPQLEAEVGKLREELKQLREDFDELKNEQKREYKTYTNDFREMLVKRQEFNESMKSLLDRKKGIDTIIEKIKKILPI